MTLKRILPIAAMALAMSAPVASAQSTGPLTTLTTLAGPLTAPLASPLAGPQLDRTRVGVSAVRETATRGLDPVPQPSISRKRGVPQMVIGGAAILGGAIVGGDAGGIVSLAGLGVGLYGLYLYLQ